MYALTIFVERLAPTTTCLFFHQTPKAVGSTPGVGNILFFLFARLRHVKIYLSIYPSLSPFIATTNDRDNHVAHSKTILYYMAFTFNIMLSHMFVTFKA